MNKHTGDTHTLNTIDQASLKLFISFMLYILECRSSMAAIINHSKF